MKKEDRKLLVAWALILFCAVVITYWGARL